MNFSSPRGRNSSGQGLGRTADSSDASSQLLIQRASSMWNSKQLSRLFVLLQALSAAQSLLPLIDFLSIKADVPFLISGALGIACSSIYLCDCCADQRLVWRAGTVATLAAVATVSNAVAQVLFWKFLIWLYTRNWPRTMYIYDVPQMALLLAQMATFVVVGVHATQVSRMLLAKEAAPDELVAGGVMGGDEVPGLQMAAAMEGGVSHTEVMQGAGSS